VKDLVGRLKSERFSGPAIEQALDLRHGRRIDCREVRAFREEVSNEAVRILIHAAFPCVIGRRKITLGAEAMGRFLVPGELFAVIVRDRMDMVAQEIQTMDRGPVGSHSRRTGPFRDGGKKAFALEMGEEGAFMMCAYNGVALPVAEP